MSALNLLSFLRENNLIPDLDWEITQIYSGAASENYRLSAPTQKLFCKILKSDRADNLIAHLNIFKTATVCPHILAKPFTYRGKTGLLLECKAGRILTHRDLTPAGVTRLVAAYREFSDALNAAEDKSSILPARDYIQFKATALTQLMQRRTFINGFILDKLISLCRAIPDSALRPQPDKMRLIHGDFTTRNILIDSTGTLSFVDMDGLRIGYEAEDFSRFIFCATDRIWTPWMRSHFLNTVIPLFRTNLPFSAAEWHYGFYAFLLRKVVKASTHSLGFLKTLKLYFAVRAVLNRLP